MSLTFSMMRGVTKTLQSAQTTGNGTVVAIPPSLHRHELLIIGNGAVGAGKIQPETADSPDYTGTWAPIGGGPIDVPVSGQTVYNFEGVFKFFRARISTNVTVSTVTVKLTSD